MSGLAGNGCWSREGEGDVRGGDEAARGGRWGRVVVAVGR